MIRTVRLYGKLGAEFGRVHHFNLDSDSPAEAIRALSS
jgi:predicted phage tail protein